MEQWRGHLITCTHHDLPSSPSCNLCVPFVLSSPLSLPPGELTFDDCDLFSRFLELTEVFREESPASKEGGVNMMECVMMHADLLEAKHKGSMTQKVDGMLGASWRTRFFVLRDMTLLAFDSEDAHRDGGHASDSWSLGALVATRLESPLQRVSLPLSKFPSWILPNGEVTKERSCAPPFIRQFLVQVSESCVGAPSSCGSCGVRCTGVSFSSTRQHQQKQHKRKEMQDTIGRSRNEKDVCLVALSSCRGPSICIRQEEKETIRW